jgi:uncharacterized protein (UPF0332 family)
MAEARRALQAAHVLLDSPVASRAVSDAYYAMLYAARAALSEEDLSAKTHRGTWDLFHRTFVAAGRFDQHLLADARSVQREREDADYDAIPSSPADARRIVELAERFVVAIEAMIGE